MESSLSFVFLFGLMVTPLFVVEFIKSLVPVIYVDVLDGVSYEGCFGYCKYTRGRVLVSVLSMSKFIFFFCHYFGG